MKVVKLSLTISLFIACSRGDESIGDIFHKWQWTKTTFDTRGFPITAQQVDSTYYYEFTRNGELRVLNNDHSLRAVKPFTLSDNGDLRIIYFPKDSLTWAYTIRRDTLRMWMPYSIWPQMDYFIIK